jgi:putative sterol carrier protein
MADFTNFMSIEELREALGDKSHGQIMNEVQAAGIEEVIGKVMMGMVISFNPAAAGKDNAVICYELKDSKNKIYRYFVKINDGQCSVEQEDPGEKPRVRLTTTIPLFLKLSAGRLKLFWPLIFGTLRIAGDKRYAAKMKKIFSGNPGGSP